MQLSTIVLLLCSVALNLAAPTPSGTSASTGAAALQSQVTALNSTIQRQIGKEASDFNNAKSLLAVSNEYQASEVANLKALTAVSNEYQASEIANVKAYIAISNQVTNTTRKPHGLAPLVLV